MNRVLDNPKHWYDRAAEMRAIADTYHCDETKEVMLNLADSYDRMGDRAAARISTNALRRPNLI